MRNFPMYNRYNSLFDEMFDDFMPKPLETTSFMKTDVHEKDGYFTLDIELPGYKKEDVSIEIMDGYLTISARHEYSDEEKNDKGQLIRQERSFGSCSRSFYVGDNIKAEDVNAKFEEGMLMVSLPSSKQKAIETKQIVSIN
ncbi:MAG: Hsp20/alpha crystallin family protein [Erysipelotrichaceae bacterium]|nr:Hsp20/alpha crystallin family protein [Erysipelotrichaceae bacterium]